MPRTPFDFRDPAFLADPYPVFRQLRATAPVLKAPLGRWFLTGYDDTALLLRDRRFGKDYDDPEALIRRFGPTALQEPAVIELTHMMLMRDPPDHTRLRGLVTKAFTARRIEALRDSIQDLTDRLLDKVIRRGRMDAIRDLAFPLPVLVICELLGIPEPDRARFVTGSSSGGALLNPTPPTRAELDSANAGIKESGAYFEALFEQRRRDPQDDLITQLVQAEEAGDRLTTAELRANVSLLFAAGHETTVNLIGNGCVLAAAPSGSMADPARRSGVDPECGRGNPALRIARPGGRPHRCRTDGTPRRQHWRRTSMVVALLGGRQPRSGSVRGSRTA